jgi:amino acid adenylation domain-containing protein
MAELEVAGRAADRSPAGPPPDRPVHEQVRARAVARPAATAIAWRDQAVSYRELMTQATLIGGALRRLGVTAGSPVAVRMATGPRQAAALLGVLQTGAYLVCFGAGDQGERGRAMLAELRPPVLVLDGAERDGDGLAAWYRDELAGRILDVAEPALHRDVPPLPARSEPGARAYVAYTSGSTGRPKGIAQTHAALAQFVTWLGGEFGVGPGSRVAQWAAPGYDASLCEVFTALAAGATLCPVPDRIRPHPEKIVDWLATERVTFFQTVPSFARAMLKVITARGPAAGLDALDHLLLAGEALPGELATALRAALPGVRLVNLYGPTESILATWYDVTGGGQEALPGTVPIGRAIPGRQVLVLDDADRPCPPGTDGQIVIRSPYVTPGYVGAAAGQRDAFRPADPARFGTSGPRWYRTGDVGRLRPDGLLDFIGRRDQQIKFNGVRVELTDIEAALADLDSVTQCAVVPLTDEDGLVVRLVAHVVPRPAAESTADSAAGAADQRGWRAQLRRRFGAALPPVSFKTLTELPRNVGGKVDRRRLQNTLSA